MILHNARKRLGTTQREFAAKTGVSESFISSVENNTANPTFERILTCLRKVGLDLDYLTIEEDTLNDIVRDLALQRTVEERLEWNTHMLEQYEWIQQNFKDSA